MGGWLPYTLIVSVSNVIFFGKFVIKIKVWPRCSGLWHQCPPSFPWYSIRTLPCLDISRSRTLISCLKLFGGSLLPIGQGPQPSSPALKLLLHPADTVHETTAPQAGLLTPLTTPSAAYTLCTFKSSDTNSDPTFLPESLYNTPVICSHHAYRLWYHLKHQSLPLTHRDHSHFDTLQYFISDEWPTGY